MLPVEEAEIHVRSVDPTIVSSKEREKKKKGNGGAPAATVKAAAANTKKKAVEKRKKLDQEIMPSDSDEDVLVPKKAPRKEDRRWLLEEQQQRRKAERSAGPEEECNCVAPAVVAAHPDEVEERRCAQAEGRGVAGAVAAATAQQKNEVATAHQPTKNASCLTTPSSSGEILEEESYWTLPAFWTSIDVIVADRERTPGDAKCGRTSCVNGSDATNSGVAASHVTVHTKLDTPASA
jgi:hypothetical protein